MKKIILTIILIGLCVFAYSRFLLYKYHLKEKAIFIKNIKEGVINQSLPPVPTAELIKLGISKFERYDFEMFKEKQVINVQNNQILSLSEVLYQPNVFINFWYKGCGGCELEMPDIQKFYDKYGSKITFVIISNDDPETVQKFIKKQSLTMPFYVLKDKKFPVGIKIFPTSHLIINNKTAYMYAGMGYYDNDEFYQFIESKW